MARYKIVGYRMAELSERIEGLNKRARKLGVPEIVTAVLGYTPGRKLAAGDYVPSKYEVEVTGGQVKLPGWDFLGTLEHTEFGNVLRAAPGKEIPETYRKGDAICDHCKLARRRKDTYLARKEETGEIMQLGHDCVRDYLGHVDPAHLAFMAELEYAMRDMEEDRDEFSRGLGGFHQGYEIRDFMEVSAELVLQFGYSKRLPATEQFPQGKMSTADDARAEINDREHKAKNGKRHLILVPSEKAEELAATVLAWAAALPENAIPYLQNVRIAVLQGLKIGYLEHRQTGLVASAIQAYLKEKNLLEERAKNPVIPSTYFGEVGKRYTIEGLKLFKKLSFEGGFNGAYFVLLFKNEAGQVFKWMTGSGHGWNEGETYSLIASVKSHSDYKDVKQTQITRCKDAKEEAEKKAKAAERKAVAKAMKKERPAHDWIFNYEHFTSAGRVDEYVCKKCHLRSTAPDAPCKTETKQENTAA
jgi:hypothetical protein